MAGSRRTGLTGRLLSAPVLTPVFLGAGAGIALALGSDKHNALAAFVAVLGALGGVGTLLTLLLLGQRVDPAVARKRRELLACLEELSDPGRFPASAESERAAAAAPAERG
jgi:hypothetical protein